LGLVVGAVVVRYYLASPGVARQQVKFAVLGFVVALALSLLGWILERMVFAASDEAIRAWFILLLNLSASLAIIAVGAGLLVSLLRYRLYDADAAISRSVAYGALTLGLLAIFAGTEKVIEALGQEYFGQSLGALAGGIGAAAAAVMIGPLHHRVSRWAEKRFQKQLIKLRHGLPLLVGDLRETASLERISDAVLDAVMDGVRARQAVLVVRGDLQGTRGINAGEVELWRARWTPAAHDGPDCDRSDPLFPMRVPLEADGHGRVGWLLLGPRPDGSFYGKEERQVLEEMADPVARAIETVRVRNEHESAIVDRLSSLERTVRQMISELSSTAAG
jgi:hypothetical protein